jgi:hypothetical protein
MKLAVPAVAASLLVLGGCGSGSAPTAPLPSPPQLATPPPRTSPAPPPENRPPSLEVRVTPTPIAGRAPLAVRVNLCRSADPDGDSLAYVFEYHGEGKRFASHCSEVHVYAAPLRSQAVFCVSDGLPRHLVCRTFRVAID